MRRIPYNPFLLTGYHSPAYFCDREKETDTMLQLIREKENLALIAPRLTGKTTLLKQFFYYLDNSDEYMPVYVNVSSSADMEEFVRLFGTAVINNLGKTYEQLETWNQSLFIHARIADEEADDSPGIISFEPLIDQEDLALQDLFRCIAQSDKHLIIAIDGFDQLARYPEKESLKLLKRCMQLAPKVRFIFSGSLPYLMLELFTQGRQPFFHSAKILELQPLEVSAYRSFALSFFEKRNLSFSAELFNALYERFEGHTGYIHLVLHRLYDYNQPVTNWNLIKHVIEELVKEHTFYFRTVLKTLSYQTGKVLHETGRATILDYALLESDDFWSKTMLYRMTKTEIYASLQELIDKELVYKNEEGYYVCDKLMLHWLINYDAENLT